MKPQRAISKYEVEIEGAIKEDLRKIYEGSYTTSGLGIKLDLISIANARINLDIETVDDGEGQKEAIWFNSDMIATIINTSEDELNKMYEEITKG